MVKVWTYNKLYIRVSALKYISNTHTHAHTHTKERERGEMSASELRRRPPNLFKKKESCQPSTLLEATPSLS
ncbi:hypothetical protein BDB00DRAFT_848109 [Zychaea mexicana]|uniref:uncharacterized protein n=1 Tax=Zychaea mexicana TaxID=64656 RepID=UPI0022FF3361|nr:uncharacterized protein BDB00DRAFT_848109 [Zychaea mexicana]KAI9488452.1 hypothetical protein BDB00DRAFT_848109 [Zychaea mexicana]